MNRREDWPINWPPVPDISDDAVIAVHATYVQHQPVDAATRAAAASAVRLMRAYADKWPWPESS